ncbi:MAG: hypothetical protein ACK4RK_16460 [Gemmataceae bacterium]
MDDFRSESLDDKHLFDDEDFFPGDSKYTLEPLLTRGEAALTCVDYDGADGKVSITFHPTGIKALAQQLADQRQERSA